MSVPVIFRPWIWALFWLTIIFSSLVIVLDKAQVDWQHKLLEKYWKSLHSSDSKKSSNIVVIGDSLVGLSFPISSEAPGFFGKNYAWENIWIGGASFKDFSNLFYGETKYDLIVVNLSTLVNDASRRTSKEAFNYPDMVKKNILGYPIKSIFYQFFLKARGRCEGRDEEAVEKVISKLKEKYNPRSLSDYDLTQFLRSMKSVAKKVIVIELPRSKVLTKKLEESLLIVKEHIYPVLKKENIEFVRLGDSMPSDHYCDGSHPNDVGREIRRVQLRNLVMERLPSTL